MLEILNNQGKNGCLLHLKVLNSLNITQTLTYLIRTQSKLTYKRRMFTLYKNLSLICFYLVIMISQVFSQYLIGKEIL